MLCLLERIQAFRSLAQDIVTLKKEAESCSRQLKAWAGSLQEAKFKGERHVNQRMKRAQEAACEREEFLKELDEIRARGRSAKSERST